MACSCMVFYSLFPLLRERIQAHFPRSGFGLELVLERLHSSLRDDMLFLLKEIFNISPCLVVSLSFLSFQSVSLKL